MSIADQNRAVIDVAATTQATLFNGHGFGAIAPPNASGKAEANATHAEIAAAEDGSVIEAKDSVEWGNNQN